jgi:PHP domain.
MTNDSKTYEIFKSGSAWIRADFHLHTKADKEFKYDGKENEFVNAYVQQLRDAGISIGAITNHNKFDLGEFKALRTKAHKEEIFLLPGIELSVKDGSNGLHTLVIFSDEWVINQENTDYINSFLSVAFAGQSNYENENARTNHDLLETIRELDKFSKEYFLIFAHVEADNGLWGGFSGGRIQELGENDLFKQRTLAFQKVITHDVPDRVCRTKVQKWLGSWYPAEVEGSDCKAIDQIGQGKPIYLKVGSFTFEAVKYALRDFQNRVSQE